MDLEDIKDKGSKYLFQNYGRMNLAFERGEGPYLYDFDGRRYLDLVAGIAVNSIGHSHPKWVKVMQGQVSKLTHVSNLYHVMEQADLAERLASIMPKGMCRSLFVNSGAEANEGALKLAVKSTGRTEVMSAHNCFHGRTSASLGATAQEKYRKGFEPLISGAYRYYEYNDIESVKGLISKRTAAVMIETIQGEGGVVPATEGFVKAVRDLCTDNGALLIVDEVQTGMGRTGKWLGVSHHDIVPDVITLAKGLGGGVPIGAVVTTDELSSTMTPGTHGTTFGGNPLVTASGCAVIDIIKEENLLNSVSETGSKWMSELRSMRSEKIVDVRGKGYMIGIQMDSDDTARRIQSDMLNRGILVNVCHGNVIRLIPPLILRSEEKDIFMEAFSANL